MMECMLSVLSGQRGKLLDSILYSSGARKLIASPVWVDEDTRHLIFPSSSASLEVGVIAVISGLITEPFIRLTVF